MHVDITAGIPSRRRFFAAAAAATLVANYAGSVSAEHRKPKTFVLLHGAWHGGWCWHKLTPLLRAQGHVVYTPTQTGLGERSHLLSRDITIDTFVQDVVNVLEWEDLHDVILVGHSFAGVPITGAADRVPQRIRHLVYLDSLIIENGQTPFDMLPPEAVSARRKLAQESSGGLSIPVPSSAAFNVTDPQDAAWLQAKCTPHPLSTWESKLQLNNSVVGNGLPATYVAVRPHYPTLGSVRTFAQAQKGWNYVELDAGHDAMVTSPEPLAELLLGI